MVHIKLIRRTVALAVAAFVAVGLAAGCGSDGSRDGASTAPYPPPRDEPIGLVPPEQGEITAEREPKSTFAIDIDTASYNYARRQILDGRLPSPETVRPEEFVNAFREDYPQPPGDGFTVVGDGSRLPDAHDIAAPAETRLLRIGLQTRADHALSRPDAALTFVVDVSGSMSEAGRLDLVRDALHYLVDELRETDSVAIVAYQSRASVLREMTPAHSRTALHRAIDDLAAGGSTNLEEGLVTGYRVARNGFVAGATNRVILLSDGLANVGNTDADPILQQIREEAAKNIALLGVGVGSEYGDALMERLADEGDGFVTYVSEREQARQLFVDRLPATLTVRALDAKVQVTFDPSTVASYRLVGYDNRRLNANEFRDDRVDGGEVGPGHSVTALYVVRLHRGAAGIVAEARVRWLGPADREARETATRISVSDLDRSFVAAPPRLRVCYAAAYFAEVLRSSRHAEEVRLTDLATVVDGAVDATEDPQVAELANLIRTARSTEQFR